MRGAQIAIEAADGNVFALAGHNGELHATGSAERDGHVLLVAETGRVRGDGATIVADKGTGPQSEVTVTADRMSMRHSTVRADFFNHYHSGVDHRPRAGANVFAQSVFRYIDERRYGVPAGAHGRHRRGGRSALDRRSAALLPRPAFGNDISGRNPRQRR